LKGVFGVVVVAKDTAADAPDHWAISTHEGGKSRFVATVDVVLQQFPVREFGLIAQKHCPTKVLDDLAQLAGRHVTSLIQAMLTLYLLLPAHKRLMHFFGLTGAASQR
jgi:hypothetical protein